MSQYRSSSSRWTAVVSRDSSADSYFVYCVKTTRIYCRPVCNARLARKANVEFHDNAAEAEKAGYRACKRCKPDLDSFDPHSDMVKKAKQAIEMAGLGKRLGLKDLAKEVELSQWHFHRVFRNITGITPKAYEKRVRNEGHKDRPQEPLPRHIHCTTASSSGSAEALPILSVVQFEASGIGQALQDNISSDESFPELVGLPWRSNGSTVDVVNDQSDNASSMSNKEIEYTIQPWASNFVLIASTDNGICSLDSGESREELLATLISLFPLASICLSGWDGKWDSDTIHGRHRPFAIVMEALLNPSGKIVNLRFDINHT